MKYGSQVKVQGPNRQGSVGSAKPMTPGKQAVDTPAKAGHSGMAKKPSMTKADVISPAKDKPIRP